MFLTEEQWPQVRVPCGRSGLLESCFLCYYIRVSEILGGKPKCWASYVGDRDKGAILAGISLIMLAPCSRLSALPPISYSSLDWGF